MNGALSVPDLQTCACLQQSCSTNTTQVSFVPVLLYHPVVLATLVYNADIVELMLGAGQAIFGFGPGTSAMHAFLHASESIKSPESWVTSQHLQRWLLLEKALQSLAHHSSDPELLSQNWEHLSEMAELAFRVYAAVEAGTVLQDYMQLRFADSFCTERFLSINCGAFV